MSTFRPSARGNPTTNVREKLSHTSDAIVGRTATVEWGSGGSQPDMSATGRINMATNSNLGWVIGRAPCEYSAPRGVGYLSAGH